MIKVRYLLILYLFYACSEHKNHAHQADSFLIKGDKYTLLINPQNFAFHFSDQQSHTTVPPHPSSGLSFSGSSVVTAEKIPQPGKVSENLFLVKNADGKEAHVKVSYEKDIFIFQITPLKITSSIFPIVPSYLLDGNVPGSGQWYKDQFGKWEVDGIKEDTMMDVDSLTDIYNSPISEIANAGGLVMARNGNFTAPGTLLRINDTSVGQISDRIPINYFQYAASGFPNVYSDVAGVHNMHNVKDANRSIRHAWLLSLTSGLAVGAFPDKWPAEKQKIFKKAIDFHYALAPYMYSTAISTYKTGYPFTLTPLTIAYPEDTMAAQLEHFEWMIGESILATPLLKNHQSGKMDIYLPKGTWFDYENGEKYEGPLMLSDFEMPLGKTPCFVGGKGIVIERQGNQLFVKIYKVADKAKITFFGMDGSSKTEITVNEPSWENVIIWDESLGQKVEYQKNRHAFQFLLNPGHNYVIR